MIETMSIYIALYLVSVFIQLAAAVVAISTIRFVRQFSFGWFLLACGFLLMVARRITPLLNNHIVPIDAVLSIIISSLLFFGILTVRKITQELKIKENKLQHLLQHDDLTQAFSRSEILYRGHIEVERAKRTQSPLGVLIMDIDHFKKVNDQFGHQVGDFILKNLTKHCNHSLREIDLIGRIGGEEFLILLPDTNLENTTQTAERIRQHIQNQSHSFANHKNIKITVSIGATCFESTECHDTDCQELLKKLVKTADTAMYQAKEAGRNRTLAIQFSS